MRRDARTEGLRWLEQAEADREGARLLFEGGSYHLACFVAQQVTEKAITAFVYAQGEEFVLLTGAERVEHERQRAEHERQRAEHERQRAEHERQHAEYERQHAEHERQRAERLAAQLRALGIEPQEG